MFATKTLARAPLRAAFLRPGMLVALQPVLPLQACRFMSAKIDPSKLTIERTKNPKAKLPKEQLLFGKTFSDHMLEIDWTKEDGWHAPKIVPYGPLSISPAASVLHYALECFEGMKAYIDDEGGARLYRPMMNMARMRKSAERLFLPSDFGEQEFLDCIAKLVAVDKDWIPKGWGYSLYIRPTMISTHPYIGVAASESAKLYVILSPVGPYYKSGFAPVKLLADPKKVRAWPGGTGDTKIGGNYAMGIKAGKEAIEKGFSQNLWLFGDDLQVTEVGTMNQFFFWTNKQGKKELVTAALDGTILPGVTRDSIIQLCKKWGEFDVVERKFTLTEVLAAIKEKRMIEAFGAGTAAIVSPVEGIHYAGVDYKIPLNADDATAKAGKLTLRLADAIMGIQYGKVKSDWSVKIPDLK